MERFRTPVAAALVAALVAALALTLAAALFVGSPAKIEGRFTPDGIHAVQVTLGGDAALTAEPSGAASFTRLPTPAAPSPVGTLPGAVLRSASAVPGATPPATPIALQSRPLRI